MIDRYEINGSTLAIIPVSGRSSKVLEETSDFIVKRSSTDIVDDSCKFFGSSYKGRHEGTKNLIGVNYKSPIIVEESKEMIFFPTSSPRFDNCWWIALQHVDQYKSQGLNTLLSFKNGTTLELDISYHSFENQLLRATRLESILRKRKNS